MTIDDRIRHKKLQYNVENAPAKVSALSSGKIDKYDYVKSKTDRTCQIFLFPSGEAFEKQTKNIEEQGKGGTSRGFTILGSK